MTTWRSELQHLVPCSVIETKFTRFPAARTVSRTLQLSTSRVHVGALGLQRDRLQIIVDISLHIGHGELEITRSLLGLECIRRERGQDFKVQRVLNSTKSAGVVRCVPSHCVAQVWSFQLSLIF